VSAYKVVQTQMKRVDVLTTALENIKPGWKGHIHVDEKGKTPLFGYGGDDRSKRAKTDGNYAPPCTIMIPGSGRAKSKGFSNAVGGASNDIGFSRDANGNFSIHVSSYDQTQHGKKWQGELLAEYGLLERIDTAMKAGAQIGHRQTYNHPRWGEVPGVKCRIKRSQ
jgi:hypothetical protein